MVCLSIFWKLCFAGLDMVSRLQSHFHHFSRLAPFTVSIWHNCPELYYHCAWRINTSSQFRDSSSAAGANEYPWKFSILMFYAFRTVEVLNLNYEELLLPARLCMIVLISLNQKQDEKTFKLFRSRERELMNKYKYVVSLWRRVSTHLYI